jgi:protein-disulfide isomerase
VNVRLVVERHRSAIRRARSHLWPVVLLGGWLAFGTSCRGGANDATGASQNQNLDLPGVDTHDFTPREKREFSRYVGQFAAPCPAVAVPLAQCILEERNCKPCLSAARAIAKAVREGMAAEQVRDLYAARFDSTTAKTISLQGSPSRGPDDAAVTIVEFADFECPFCQALAPKLDGIWETRKDSVRFVYKFLPLAMHPHGEIAARAAIAAQAQGKFWEMHRELFASGGRLEESDLRAYAKAAGLDLAQFAADMNSPATTAHIETDRKLAEDLGVKGTPTIFINGREFDSKLDMAEWVDTEIAAAAHPNAR